MNISIAVFIFRCLLSISMCVSMWCCGSSGVVLIALPEPAPSWKREGVRIIRKQAADHMLEFGIRTIHSDDQRRRKERMAKYIAHAREFNHSDPAVNFSGAGFCPDISRSHRGGKTPVKHGGQKIHPALPADGAPIDAVVTPRASAAEPRGMGQLVRDHVKSDTCLVM